MTNDDAILLTAGHDMWSTAAIPGVPSAKLADGPMGIASGRVDERDVSVLTPSGVALGATFDPSLVMKVGAIVGGEAKRLGVDFVLAPNLNLARSPMAGRAFELMGEDPLLAGTLGVAWIGGMQSRHVGAVAKHLVCNDSETMRDSYDAIVDDAALHEIYLLPFEMAAAAGCAGLMAAYNKVNGTHCAENARLLMHIVRDTWHYTGFTVCDWFGSKSTATAMNAGLDLEMPGPARFYGAKLADAIADGAVAAPVALTAATRIADAAQRWAGGDAGTDPDDRDDILAEAAAASFVLLRNDGDLLPVAPASIGTLAVIGPNAAAPCFQGGTFAKIALRPDAILPVEGLRTTFSGTRVTFAPGCDPAPRLPAMPATPARDIGDGCTTGMTVDFFDGHDFTQIPIGSETRATNSLTWFGGMPGLGAFDRSGGVRAAGIVTPGTSGVHSLHAGGTGSVRALVDGVEVFAQDRTIAPADIMGVLKSGDSESVEIALDAGKPVLIEIELRFTPARAQGLWFGLRAPGDAEALLADAEAVARDADLVLLLLGETADSGVESRDRDTTSLPAEQLLLAERVMAANPNVVVAVNVAHAFDTAFAADARALMLVWYPGEAFGPALADVIVGRREPSGRLPIAIAAREDDYPVLHPRPDADGRLVYGEGTGIGYRGMARAGVAPAFGFGAGLGYGRFDYRAVRAERRADSGVALVVTVRNDGDRASAAVVQAYREDGLALVGFAKQVIAPHAVADIALAIPPIALRRWIDGGWQPPTGALTLGIGPSSTDRPLRTTLDFD